MRNKGEHAQYDLIDIQGKMTMSVNVEIVNIHHGGVALIADRKLDVGCEYMIKLGDEDHSIDVKGMVVRSTLVGMEPRPHGENALLYAVGMKFREGYEDKITAFLNSVEHHTKEEKAQAVERRQAVRFQITAPQERVLLFPAHFKVKDITLGSVLIQSDQPLEKGSIVPLELHLNENDKLNFIGKVFSSRKVENRELPHFEIEVKYPDLADNDRVMLKKFIDYLAADHTLEKAD